MVHEVHGAVAATGAPDGPYGGVVQHLLNVRCTFLGRARLLEVFAADAGPQLHFQAPAFRQGDAVAQLIHRDGAGRGHDGDGVTGAEGRRDRHGHGAKVSSLVQTE